MIILRLVACKRVEVSPEKNIAEMKRSRGALITMVTVLLDFSHAFDFSEGQNQAALGLVKSVK